MSPETEHQLADGLRVQIDRDLCVGFGDCVEEAPDGFRLDGENIVVFGEGVGQLGREQLLRACDVCPVDALTVWDAEDNQLVP